MQSISPIVVTVVGHIKERLVVNRVRYQATMLSLFFAVTVGSSACLAEEEKTNSETKNRQNLNHTDIGQTTNFGNDMGFKVLSTEDPFQLRLFLPIYRLIVEPEKYNGREVCFSGFWASQVDGCNGVTGYAVFPTKEDALDFATLNAVLLTLRGKPVIPHISNGNRVKVRGILRLGGTFSNVHAVVDAINISE